jgi:dipeptidase E
MDVPSRAEGERLRRPIMVIGGGAFGLDTRGGALEDHWLAMARSVNGRDRPRVCLIPTATGDADAVIDHFHEVFGSTAEASHLALFDRTVEDIDALLVAQDAIYVAGGNTASMLGVWRAHEVDTALRHAHDAGVLLAGRSAGGLCWFEGGTTDSFGPRLAALIDGLGLIPGSHCPHYDGELERRPTYHAMIGRGELPDGLAIDDFAAAVFDGPDLVEIVAAREGPAAYRVERTSSGVIETTLPVRVLAPVRA